jgi:hypothetical protein
MIPIYGPRRHARYYKKSRASRYSHDLWAWMPIYEAYDSPMSAIPELVRIFMLQNPERAQGFNYRNPLFYASMNNHHRAHYYKYYHVESPSTLG